MSNEIFPFKFAEGADEGFSHQTEVYRMGGGRKVRAALLSSAGEYGIAGDLFLPQGAYTYDDFVAFAHARRDAYDSFLFKPVSEEHGKSVLEAVGTGDASEQDFPLDFRYVDTSTLLVYKDAVLQTISTHYTLQDPAGGAYALGDDGLQIHFNSAPGGGVAITATYWYYVPVHFLQDQVARLAGYRRYKGTTATSAFRVRGLALEQDSPGSHLVTVPTP